MSKPGAKPRSGWIGYPITDEDKPNRREKMLTKVDGRNCHTVFKVTNRKGELVCYRVFPDHMIGDAGAANEYPTLTEARSTIGTIKHKSKITAPKSSYVQNQLGFHASNSPQKEKKSNGKRKK